ncbi:MAG: carbamoyltransferase HypF [Candidatus Edwardsbacteria bacterium]
MKKTRANLLIKGIVQGVGFRPFVYRLSHRYQLTGWVSNSTKGVEIEVEGEEERIEKFISALPVEAPPLSVIEEIKVNFLEKPKGYEQFKIRGSLKEETSFTLISPDIATCPECQQELFDKKDRRYLYPFINCTNCGPRLSIIKETPYDRPATTMADFKMCPECLREYESPLNRRFHAQPNACPLCGPSLTLLEAQGKVIKKKSEIEYTIDLLREGKIVAIKGIGGFHIACDATNEEAVQELRRRKNRPDKPFALMAHSVEIIRQFCEVSEEEAKSLLSPQAPIVLLKKNLRPTIPIAPSIAPYNRYLGVMLPYTPLHHLLFRNSPTVLVMTSGNLQDEPIVTDNEEAIKRLSGIADYFLLHNREIQNRNDDSIILVIPPPVGEGKGGVTPMVQIIRHSRGYAPHPIRLPFKSKKILATGPQMKNTFCLASGDYAFVSQHIGEMENLETLQFFEEMVERYKRWFKITPEIIAYDLHPDYLTTRWAKKQSDVTLIPVQHHEAHIASNLVDNEIAESVIGIAFDGTGYGRDRNIWGGEFFITPPFVKEKNGGFRRIGHLKYLPLPGGETSIKKPYRIALAYLYYLFGETHSDLFSGVGTFHETPLQREINIIVKQIETNFNLAWTSSLGRLFDAVAAMLNVCQKITFEAQGPMALESLVREDSDETYECEIKCEDKNLSTVSPVRDCVLGSAELRISNGVSVAEWLINPKEILKSILSDLQRHLPPKIIATKFHNSVVDFTVKMCENLRLETGLEKVALSGGVFQNRYLLEKTLQKLTRSGFEVFIHHKVPANDGGISLGQIAIANIKNQI